MSVTKIRQKTVVEQIMAQIKSLIASGEYKPGDKIPTELELSETFGVGRSSIREAVKIFNYLGVLKSKAAKGTYVQERSNISTEALTWSLLLGNDEMEEMIDLRGAIELWSILALSKKVSVGNPEAREVIKTLKQIVDQMNISVKDGHIEELIEADFQFHNTIIKAQENAQFNSLYQTLRSFLVEEIRTSHEDYQNPALIPEEHGNIIKAISSGNPEIVLLKYTDHIENTKRRVQNRAAVQ
jgi:GntR family transcriptional regulator, transcriptional repressor for pyruvate dehydrogenase complex